MALRMILPTSVAGDVQQTAAAFGRHFANIRTNLVAPRASGFDFPTQLVGKTPDGNVTVYYDPSLAFSGASLANQVLAGAADAYARSQAYFNLPAQQVNAIIAPVHGAVDGSGGAYHYGCNFTSGGDLYCDAAIGNPIMTIGLMVAELTESFMGTQNKGWDCGGSNGEALSRLLAELNSGGSNGALAAFASAPVWDQQGRPNWIDASQPTDQNLVSTGCGVLYLYWMISNGLSPAAITQAGCPDGSLASNYAALTGGKATAWIDFSTAVKKLTSPITSDNPWGPLPGPN